MALVQQPVEFLTPLSATATCATATSATATTATVAPIYDTLGEASWPGATLAGAAVVPTEQPRKHFACPVVEVWARQCEFISLGCYCTVAQAIKDLGIRQRAYPFDWVRSPMEGVIRCFEEQFEDFLTFTDSRQAHGHTVFEGSRWGGSFWHHDIMDDKVHNDFIKRIERLLGKGEVPPKTPRVFVRVANSSRDVEMVFQLKRSLQQAFPDAPIYVLLIVDMQEVNCLARIDGADADNLLFFLLDHRTVFKYSLASKDDFLHRSATYAEAIAAAAAYWAAEGRASRASGAVAAFPSVRQFSASLEQWYGGDCASQLFCPQYFKGRKVRSDGVVGLPKLLHGRNVEFRLPDGVLPGTRLQVHMFDTLVTLEMPPDAVAGALFKCRLVEGVLSVKMIHATEAGAP